MAGDDYACFAYWACMYAGDNPWFNCVRTNLIIKYKECDCSSCIIKDHWYYFWECPIDGGGSVNNGETFPYITY